MREKQNQTQTADQSQSQQSGTSKTGGTKEGTKDGTKAENSSDKDSTKENRVTGDISDETKEGKDVSTSGTGQITGVGKAAPEEAQTAGTGTGVSGENDGHSAAGDGGSSGSYTGLQENKGALIDQRKHDHAQIDPEGSHRELRIIDAFIGSTEDSDQLPREKLHDHQGNQAGGRLTFQKQCKKILCALLQACSDIISHDGNAAGRQPDRNRDHDLEELHDDTDNRHRNLCILLL